jgi:hypothetical protein
MCHQPLSIYIGKCQNDFAGIRIHRYASVAGIWVISVCAVCPGAEVQPAVLCKDRQYLIYIPGTIADTIC